MLMAVRKFHADRPSPIRHPIHWCRGGVPMIEISHQKNVTRFLRFAEKGHMMETPARAQARRFGVRGSLRNHRVHGFGLWHLADMLVCERAFEGRVPFMRAQRVSPTSKQLLVC